MQRRVAAYWAWEGVGSKGIQVDKATHLSLFGDQREGG